MGRGNDHLRFDELLRDNGIIKLGEFDCDQVHDRMDRDMMSYGGPKHHQDRDPSHREGGIREWIRSGRDSFWDSFASILGFSFYDHRMSDFVRVCLGHIVLDEFWAKYDMEGDPQKTPDEVIELAFSTFQRRGHDTARFKR